MSTPQIDQSNNPPILGQSFVGHIPGVSICSPENIDLYILTEADLAILEDTNGDGLGNAAWGLAGIAGGSLVPVLQRLYAAFIADSEVPLSGIATIEIILFIGSLAGSAVIFIVSYKRTGKSKAKFDEIRKRKKTQTTQPLIINTTGGGE